MKNSKEFKSIIRKLNNEQLEKITYIIQNKIEEFMNSKKIKGNDFIKNNLLINNISEEASLINKINTSVNKINTSVNKVNTSSRILAKEGLKCPKCGCTDLNKNGKTNDKQRYICKGCRITFDKTSNSPLSGTKLSLEKWFKYCELMIHGGSIRQCARVISVSVPTSFYMRHRILDVLNLSISREELNGSVEIDHYLLPECFKGQRSAFNKNCKFERNYSIGFESMELEIIREKSIHKKSLSDKLYKNNYKGNICIQTAIDGNGHIISRVISKERPNLEDFSKFFGDKLKNTSIFYVPKNKSFPNLKLLNSMKNIKYIKVQRFSYDLNIVDGYCRRLDTWMKQFKGVASKYLNNYLSWFKLLYKFLYKSEKKNDCEVINDIFFRVIGENLKITQYYIKDRMIDFI